MQKWNPERKETPRGPHNPPIWILRPLSLPMMSSWNFCNPSFVTYIPKKCLSEEKKCWRKKHSHSQSLEDVRGWPQGLDEDTDVRSIMPRPTLCSRRHKCGLFYQKHNVAFVVFIYTLLSIRHHEVRGKHECPMLLVQLTNNWTTRQRVLTDKTGINNNIPNEGTMGKELQLDETFWETRYSGHQALKGTERWWQIKTRGFERANTHRSRESTLSTGRRWSGKFSVIHSARIETCTKYLLGARHCRTCLEDSTMDKTNTPVSWSLHSSWGKTDDKQMK